MEGVTSPRSRSHRRTCLGPTRLRSWQVLRHCRQLAVQPNQLWLMRRHQLRLVLQHVSLEKPLGRVRSHRRTCLGPRLLLWECLHLPTPQLPHPLRIQPLRPQRLRLQPLPLQQLRLVVRQTPTKALGSRSCPNRPKICSGVQIRVNHPVNHQPRLLLLPVLLVCRLLV